MQIDNELKNILKELDLYWETDIFQDDEDDRENMRIKQQITDLIEKSYHYHGDDVDNSEFREEAQKYLLFLAKNSGCASDFIVAEELTGALFEDGVLDKALITYYCSNEYRRQG